ncbi:MAG: transcription termination/antitermination protein NusG [Candidatus Omnitrophota bacterium]
MAKNWYVIHTLTGYEDKVKSALDKKIEVGGGNSAISQVMIPTEQVAEIKGGKKKISQRKFFPGYVLVEMELTDDSWYAIKTTAGVSGFVGAGSRPVPLSETEIEAILKEAQSSKEKPIPKVLFEKGESVRVIEGPFINFNGSVDEVNLTKGKLKVMISIFGRATPIELEMWQVEKM